MTLTDGIADNPQLSRVDEPPEDIGVRDDAVEGVIGDMRVYLCRADAGVADVDAGLDQLSWRSR
jgi:hypothetical protein